MSSFSYRLCQCLWPRSHSILFFLYLTEIERIMGLTWEFVQYVNFVKHLPTDSSTSAAVILGPESFPPALLYRWVIRRIGECSGPNTDKRAYIKMRTFAEYTYEYSLLGKSYYLISHFNCSHTILWRYDKLGMQKNRLLPFDAKPILHFAQSLSETIFPPLLPPTPKKNKL